MFIVKLSGFIGAWNKKNLTSCNTFKHILTKLFLSCTLLTDIFPSVEKFTGSLIHECIYAKTLNQMEYNSRI